MTKCARCGEDFIHVVSPCENCMRLMEQVFDDISNQRILQDYQWGGAAHDDQHLPMEWMAFIQKQVTAARSTDARERFIKIAALAVAAVESIDRKKILDSE